jgi:hypothetical protein
MTLRDPTLLECREVVEVVSDFLSGAMTAEDRHSQEPVLWSKTCVAYAVLGISRA